jgi:ubiquinone biosynthesis protein
MAPVLQRLGIASTVTLGSRFKPDPATESEPVRFRKALEELGPTFIKLGQLLSTREDVVGRSMAEELSKLQDDVPTFDFLTAKQTIETDLGKPIGRVFSSLDPKPLASASIGQVYLGRLKDGRKVVVKVLRPGIKETVDEDLAIMRHLADLAYRYIPESRAYGPREVVAEFDRSIHKEMDYLLEAKNAKRFYENFRADPTIVIPKVYEDYCTTRVLTMEYINGVKFKDLSKSDKRFDRKALAHRLARAFFKMALVDGYFHADPHPSNIIALPKNRVCFIDFGMVGHLGPEYTEELAGLFMALMSNDVDAMMVCMEDLGMVSSYVNQADLRRDLADLMDEYYDTKIENVQVGEFMRKLTSLTSRHSAMLPRDLVLLSRGIVVLEGTCRALDPKFNSVQVFKPFVSEMSRKRNGLGKLVSQIPSAAFEMSRLAKTAPASIRSILSKIEAGKLEVEFEHKDLNTFTGEMERTSNKISLALILSALIIGSALVLTIDKGVTLFGLPVLGLVGFLFSAIIGVWLVIGILRYKQM